jgi:hypothetical protein
MKKFKIGIWAAILGFVVIVLYQNQDFFLTKQSLGINLLFSDYKLPAIYNLVLVFIFFIAGLLLGSYFYIVDRLRFNKRIKMLNAEKNSQRKEISALQSELVSLKGSTSDTDSRTMVIKPGAKEPAKVQQEQE